MSHTMGGGAGTERWWSHGIILQAGGALSGGRPWPGCTEAHAGGGGMGGAGTGGGCDLWGTTGGCFFIAAVM